MLTPQCGVLQSTSGLSQLKIKWCIKNIIKEGVTKKEGTIRKSDVEYICAICTSAIIFRTYTAVYYK